MNRIVLIGNGFDIAHLLKTSYKDFIEYLWKGIYDELKNKTYLPNGNDDHNFKDSQELIDIPYSTLENREGQIVLTYNGTEYITSELNEEYIADIKGFINTIQKINPIYPNIIFKTISFNYIEKNWSDIEADYYRELKNCKDSNVESLNKSFLQIKGLLRNYLSALEAETSITEIDTIMYSPIIPEHIKITRLQIVCDYLNEKISRLDNVSKKKIKDYLTRKEVVKSDFSVSYGSETEDVIEARNIVPDDILRKSLFKDEYKDILDPESILFLSFNYTDTIKQYESEKKSVETIQIHGTLGATEEMIFGYGDEDDEKYKELEMSEIPGMLDNVKSINYLQSSNYRNLERFIESGPYQIFIMGMSCGLADRTLLRKLFQHKNCISILPYYYEYKDKEGNSKDNFSGLIQNISRCFSDKDLLRSIVVDKTKCSPLPQMQHNNI
ncbi:MAG: AbiH family protein [Dysgonamonadaceae bacterium]